MQHETRERQEWGILRLLSVMIAGWIVGLAIIVAITVWWRAQADAVRADHVTPTIGTAYATAAPDDGLATGATVEGAAERATLVAGQAGVRYYTVDGSGMQTFSPLPAARVACWWINIGQTEGMGMSSRPAIPTRAAGLSCAQLDQDGWAEYVERFPAR